jgi:hypothetical protein
MAVGQLEHGSPYANGLKHLQFSTFLKDQEKQSKAFKVIRG